MKQRSRLKIVFSAVAMGIIFVPLVPLGKSDAEDQGPSRAESYFYFIRGTLESLNGNSNQALRFYSQSQQINQNSAYIKLKQAEEYLNLSETETAARLLHDIAATFVNDPEYFVLRARVQAQSGHYEAGLKDLDRSVNLYFANRNPAKAREIVLTKVALQADQKDYKGSVKSLQKYLKRNPSDEIAYYFLGKVHSLFSQRDPAKKAYQKALDIRPTFVAAAKALGLIYELEGKPNDAFTIYQDIVRSGIVDDEILQKVINLALIREDYPLALEAIGQALQWHPDDLQNNLRAGLIHFKLGHFDSAEGYFVAAEALDGAPKDRIDFYLGNTLTALGRHEEALQSLGRVEANSDYFPEARIQMSQIYEKVLAQKVSALKVLDDAIAVKASLELTLAKANLLEGRGELQLAIQFLLDVKKDFPNNERLLLVLGSLQDRHGLTDDSVTTMRSILAFNENSVQALNHIGYSLTEKGVRLDEAEALLKHAVQLAPKNGFILDSLGWLYFKTGHYQKALEFLRRANDLSPQQAIILEHLGDTLHKLNRITEALATYRQIVKTESESESAGGDTESRIVKERVREKLSLLVDASPRE